MSQTLLDSLFTCLNDKNTKLLIHTIVSSKIIL